MKRQTLLSILMLAVLVTAAHGGDLTLVDGQGSRAVVIVAVDAGEHEELAVRELNQHLITMCGKELPVVRVKPDTANAEAAKVRGNQQIPLIIGSLAMDDRLKAAIHAKGSDPAAFGIRADDQDIRIAGLSSVGTLNGCYALLEELGCRWFMPGEFGTVIPKTAILKLSTQETAESPSFEGRTLQMLEGQKDWYRRMRLGGKSVPGAHGINIGKPKLEERPELFAIVNGTRVPHQYCITHPEVLKLVLENARAFFRENPNADMIGMGPGDGRDFCECERCRALDAGDWDPYAKIVSITDRYVWFFNSVLEAIDAEFPNKSIAFYAYDGTMRPPVKVKPNPRIIPVFALIRVCHLHGMSNPVCPERGYYQTLLKQWSGMVNQCFDRDYLLNYSGYPVSHVNRAAEEIPLLNKFKVSRVRRQTYPSWGNMTPGIYVTAKLLWNANADVKAIEKDFYSKFFGEASAPMARYFARLEAAYGGVDHHPRWEVVDMGRVLPPDAIAACRADLDEAAKLGTDAMVTKRVAVFRMMHDSLELYLSTIQQQDRFDFASARATVGKLASLQKVQTQHDPQLLSEVTAVSLQKGIEDAYAKTTGNNSFLAGTSRTWDFLIDPVHIGETLQFFATDLRGGGWTKRPLSSIALKGLAADWGEDLRWYAGEGWYRTTVKLPTLPADQQVLLWFRRIPEGSKVWVNGQLVGHVESSAGMRTPYDVDVTRVAVSGGDNTIAVRATGPIHGPVMFYATPVAAAAKP